MAQFIWTSIQNLKPLAQQMAEIFHQKWMKILLYLTYYTVMLLKVQSLDNNISTTDYAVQTPFVKVQCLVNNKNYSSLAFHT